MIDKLILGTAQLGLDYGINNQLGKPPTALALEILHTAYDHGIRVLDTAEAYGSSQNIIGTFHKSNPTKKFKVISKLDAKKSVFKTGLTDIINKNVKTLGINALEGYMFHNYENLKQNPHLLQEALKAKKEGKIKKLGVSVYTNLEVEDIIQNYREVDFVQAPFNLLDNQQKRKKAFEKLKEKGIEVHTRSVFLQGLFFRAQESLNEKIQPLRPYLEELENIKRQKSISTEKLALQYVLQKDYIDRILIGVETPQQLLQNIANSKNNIYIPHEEINEINVKKKELLNPTNWN